MGRDQQEATTVTPPIDPGDAANTSQSGGYLVSMIVPFAMAFLGAFAKLAASNECCRSWKRTLRCTFVSAFTGMIVTLLLVDTDLPPPTVGALSGLAAYSGTQSLDKMAEALSSLAQWMVDRTTRGK